MGTFKQFLTEEEAAPPGVDPTMWANPSYRKFWQAQNQQQPQQTAQQQPGWKPAAQQQQAAPFSQGYQDFGSIEGAIKTYLSKMPGMPSTGTVRQLTDMPLRVAIEKGIRDRSIPLHPSMIKAMEAGRGVHFYRDRQGNVAFSANR